MSNTPVHGQTRSLYQCQCYGTRQERQQHWEIWIYRGNYSAFNGNRFTPSDYSQIVCTRCGSVWRTKAAYVNTLPFKDTVA